MTGVTWLLLDVGGVLELVEDDSWPAQFATEWEERLGLERGGFSARLQDAELPDSARQSGVADDYWRTMGLALAATDDQVAAMRANFWDRYCGVANDELLRYLRTLRGTVGMAILSNSGDGAREEEERRFAFSELFAPICYSHEIGVLKPDPAAFEIALGAMRAMAGQTLFVDNVADNVEAARALGLRAHLHTDNATTITAIGHALSRRQ